MAVKTSLPPIKRVFWLFLTTAVLIVLAGVLATPTPSADVTPPGFVDNPPGNTLAGENCASSKLDAIFLIDNSGTMDDSNAAALAKRVVGQAESKWLTDRDRVALATFAYKDDTAEKILKKEFTSNFAEVTEAAKNLNFNADSSNAGQGIRFAEEYQRDTGRAENGQDFPAIVIVVTDSQSSVNENARTIAKTAFDERGVRFYGIALGGQNPGLRTLAQNAGGTYQVAANQDQVETAVTTLFATIKTNFANCISLSLQADKSIMKEGENVVLTYAYSNQTREDLTDAAIRQTLPTDFKTSDGATAVNVSLGTLQAGTSGTKTVTLQTVGN